MLGPRHSIVLLFVFASACQSSTPPAPSAPVPSPSALPSATVPPPTLTAAPSTSTATLPPAPPLFRDEFDGTASYWQFIQAGAASDGFEARALTGALRLSIPGPHQWITGIYDAQVYSDVRLDARVEFGTGGQGAVGLICRYDTSTGWYEFDIFPDQTYTLIFGQWLSQGVARYTPLVISASEKIDPAVNEIGLGCEGAVLTPYVNGVQLRRREEKLHALSQGAVGISAASFEQAPLVLSFDWISVSEP